MGQEPTSGSATPPTSRSATTDHQETVLAEVMQRGVESSVGQPPTVRSETWKASRSALAAHERDATLEKAIARFVDVINNHSQDPRAHIDKGQRDETTKGLTKFLLAAPLSAETIRKRKRGVSGDEPWTWDYLEDQLAERAPATYVKLQEIRGKKLDDWSRDDWSRIDIPFPTTVGRGRRAALRSYVDRLTELVDIAPKSMLGRGRSTDELAILYCESAIQLVRVIGSDAHLQGTSKSASEGWREAAEAGKRALRGIEPVVRVADELGRQKRQREYDEYFGPEDDALWWPGRLWRSKTKFGGWAIRRELGGVFDDFDGASSVPDERIPVAASLLQNPLREAVFSGGDIDEMGMDVPDILVTRFHLLVAETVYATAMTQQRDASPAEAIAAVRSSLRDPDSPQLILGRDPDLLGIIGGLAACALVDRDPTESSARQAIDFISAESGNLWGLAPITDVHPDIKKDTAVETRPLARLWCHLHDHKETKGLACTSELEARLINLHQSQSEHQAPKAAADEPYYRVPPPTEYSPDADLVTKIASLKSSTQEDRFDAFWSLQEMVAWRWKEVLDDASSHGYPFLRGVNYLDPIPTGLLPGLAEVQTKTAKAIRKKLDDDEAGEFGSETLAPFRKWFDQLRQLFRSPMWQALPAAAQETWGSEVIKPFGIDLPDTDWREILAKHSAYLPVPTEPVLKDLEKQVALTEEVFRQGATVPDIRHDLFDLGRRMDNLQLQLQIGHNEGGILPAEAPRDFRHRARDHWHEYLLPKLDQLDGPARHEATNRQVGKGWFTLDGNSKVKYWVNLPTAEIELTVAILPDANNPDAVDASSLLGRLATLQFRDSSLPRVGLAAELADKGQVVLTTSLLIERLTVDELVGVATKLARHPLITSES